MAIIKCELDEQERGCTIKRGQGTYTKRWRIITDGEDYSGLQVLEEAILLDPMDGDPVDGEGDEYTMLGAEDDRSYATSLKCDLEDKTNPDVWIAEVTFEPPQPGEDRTGEPNPLSWAPEYWFEENEKEVPIEEARCMTNLPTILRGPDYAGGSGDPDYDEDGSGLPKFGPVVNAAGMQTIDPLTETEFDLVVCAQINLPTLLAAAALHSLWKRTTNDDEFLGDPARSWKFISAIPDKKQEKRVSGVGLVTYFPTVVKIGYRQEHTPGEENGWDRKVLNNGQVCFRHSINPAGEEREDFYRDPVSTKPAFFPTLVRQIKDEAIDAVAADEAHILTKDDYENTESSEPVNLKVDGSQITNAETKANHILYRYLREADYSEMTYYNVVTATDVPIFSL